MYGRHVSAPGSRAGGGAGGVSSYSWSHRTMSMNWNLGYGTRDSLMNVLMVSSLAVMPRALGAKLEKKMDGSSPSASKS